MSRRQTTASEGKPPAGAEPREERFGLADQGSRAERRRREKGRAKRAAKGRIPGLIWWASGGGLVVAAVIVAAIVASHGGGSSPAPPPAPAGTARFTEPSRSHVQGQVAYDRTPPVGGNHAPVWLNCGVYDLPVPNENAVHSLEHGAVWITYQPSLTAADVQALQALAISKYRGPDRYVILSPYPGLSAPIVASAWGAQLQLSSASDPRLGQFVDHFREGPQDLERGASCRGGLGTPIA